MTPNKLRRITAVLVLALALLAVAAASTGAVQYVFASHEDAVPGVMPSGADAMSDHVMPMPGPADASADR